MAKKEKNYLREAASEALEMVEGLSEQIADQILEKGKADKNLSRYDGGDSYHYDHVDRDYDLFEAAKILDQLYNFEEEDEALWEGRSPRDAVSAQAAYTYGNAVLAEWQEMIEKINQAIEEELQEEVGPREWSPRGKRVVKTRIKEIIQGILDVERQQ